MDIALCAIIKDENPYLGEWLNHHRSIGVDYFILYDNNSQDPIKEYIEKNSLNKGDISVIPWLDKNTGSQMRAYMNCCKLYPSYNYIGFIDMDEFVMLKEGNLKDNFKRLQKKGTFDGLGLYWRMYGANPYFTERHPISDYKQWSPNPHIKSFVNPKVVLHFNDPHKAQLAPGSIYIDENHNPVIKSLGSHSSNNIWIKHTFTRSLPEFEEKLKRGRADLQRSTRTIEEFYIHNDNLTNID